MNTRMLLICAAALIPFIAAGCCHNDSITAEVGPVGGTISLPGAVSVTVPHGAIQHETTVAIARQPSQAVLEQAPGGEVLFNVTSIGRNALEIDVGAVQPQAPIRVSVLIPSGMRTRAAEKTRLVLLALNLVHDGDSPIVTLENISKLNPASAPVIEVDLPPSSFQQFDSQRYKAIILPATVAWPEQRLMRSTKGTVVTRTKLSETSCGGFAMGPPLPGQYRVTSKFGPRKRNGVDETHYGVDYGAESDKPEHRRVMAMASGVVIQVGYQFNQNIGRGWGWHILLAHGPNRTAPFTLYAHLEENSATVKPGDAVATGQHIGQLGSSGGSSGPHLHVEFVPKANEYNDGQKTDPEKCKGILQVVRATGRCDAGAGISGVGGEADSDRLFPYPEGPDVANLKWSGSASGEVDRVVNNKHYKGKGTAKTEIDITSTPSTAHVSFVHTGDIEAPMGAGGNPSCGSSGDAGVLFNLSGKTEYSLTVRYQVTGRAFWSVKVASQTQNGSILPNIGELYSDHLAPAPEMTYTKVFSGTLPADAKGIGLQTAIAKQGNERFNGSYTLEVTLDLRPAKEQK